MSIFKFSFNKQKSAGVQLQKKRHLTVVNLELFEFSEIATEICS